MKVLAEEEALMVSLRLLILRRQPLTEVGNHLNQRPLHHLINVLIKEQPRELLQ